MFLQEYIKFLSHVIDCLGRRVSRWSFDELRAWFYGFIIGDGSYNCVRPRAYTLEVETTHLGTLLGFVTVATKLSDKGFCRVYAYPRKEGYTRWKLRAYIVNVEEHETLCMEDIYGLVREFSEDIRLWSAFTAGFIDSDGTIILSVKKRYRPRPHYYLEPEIIIVDQDKRLLELVKNIWSKYNVYGYVHSHPGKLYRYRLTAKCEIRKLLEHVVKYMLNIERLGKASLLKAVLEESVTIEPLRIKTIMDKIRKHITQLKETATLLSREMYFKNKSLIITKDYKIIIVERKRKYKADH